MVYVASPQARHNFFSPMLIPIKYLHTRSSHLLTLIRSTYLYFNLKLNFLYL